MSGAWADDANRPIPLVATILRTLTGLALLGAAPLQIPAIPIITSRQSASLSLRHPTWPFLLRTAISSLPV